MMARLVGIILGVILATSGYVIAGWGVLGDWAQHLDLGPFEPHRPFVGWAAAITGGVLLVAALTPRPKPRRKAKPAPADLGGDLVATPVVAVESTPEPVVGVVSAAPELEPEPEPVQPAPVVVPVVAQAVVPPIEAPGETFADLRAQLVTLSRQDAWPEAGRTLGRLLRVAADDQERAVAHRDLGDFARGQGRLDDAAEAYEKAVDYARSVRADRPDDFAADDLLAGARAGGGGQAGKGGQHQPARAPLGGGPPFRSAGLCGSSGGPHRLAE